MFDCPLNSLSDPNPKIEEKPNISIKLSLVDYGKKLFSNLSLLKFKLFFFKISYSELVNIWEKGQGLVPAMKYGIFKNNKVHNDFFTFKYA